VYAVTNEKGKNRETRHRLTYPKILTHGKLGSVALKLADRIANVEACRLFSNRGLLAMYQHEHAGFRYALFGERSLTEKVHEPALWMHLDNLMIN
jgi:hypothetical protein